ncbi:hypothetical protein GCM10027589_58590 [Actinocorallia lasiicapitis]
MTELKAPHTSAPDASTLRTLRRFLDDVFDTDGDHALGGIPALLWGDGELIGHAAVVDTPQPILSTSPPP